MQAGDVYLVTGGCGFIGAQLAHELVARRIRVRVLDDLSTGDAMALPAGVDLVQADVCNPEALREAMADVAGCFHLAAVASIERTRTSWLAGHRTNVGGTVAVLEAARDRPGAPVPVVYASSAAVYGETGDPPLAEDLPCAPCSPYGIDKLGSEHHAAVASNLFGVPTLGLRFFNVYGPGQRAGSPYSGVITRFCERLLDRRPITVFGDGLQTRDFIFVGDVVRALIAAMERLPVEPRAINVCTGKPTSVLEVAALLAGDHEAEVIHEPARAGEVRHSCGNPHLLSHLLGAAARTPLSEGLAMTRSWYLERLVGAHAAAQPLMA